MHIAMISDKILRFIRFAPLIVIVIRSSRIGPEFRPSATTGAYGKWKAMTNSNYTMLPRDWKAFLFSKQLDTISSANRICLYHSLYKFKMAARRRPFLIQT